MMQELPVVYSSLEENQRDDSWCKELTEALKKGDPKVTKFRLHKNLLCYQPKGAKTRRYVVPALLSPMLLKYFHDCPMSRHLGAFKTWKEVGRQFFWPKLRDDVFKYVRQCDLCQHAKLARDARVGLHAATPASYPLERVFLDFMGPLVRTKRGNQAIFVVKDGFSKFVAFYPVHNITSSVVCNILKSWFFYGLWGT
jgi:hypothetical protein